VGDVQGALTVQIIFEYGIYLVESFDHQHVGRFTKSGNYTSKSAYEAFIPGKIRFAPWKKELEIFGLLLSCKFFTWLAIGHRWGNNWTPASVMCLLKRNLDVGVPETEQPSVGRFSKQGEIPSFEGAEAMRSFSYHSGLAAPSLPWSVDYNISTKTLQ
jgi:hypothetical protein